MERDGLAKAIAEEVAGLIRSEIERISAPSIQPALLTVKRAAIYVGRSEQAVQHLILRSNACGARGGAREITWNN
jgi:hypothetical protein